MIVANQPAQRVAEPAPEGGRTTKPDEGEAAG